MERNPAGRETQSGRRAGVGRIATGLGLAVVLAVVVATFLANTGIPTTGHPTAGDLRPPAALAGAPLAESVRGPAALREVARLHGRRIDAADALVLHYEQGIVLWITTSRSALRGTALLWRMNRRMAGGTSVFTAPQAREIHGRTVFSTAGLGARHFYYQSGNNVLWLQAPEGLAEAALQDLLTHYP